MHGLATHDAGGLDLHAAALDTDELAFAVDRFTEGVDDPAQHAVTDRDRQDPSGRFHRLALLDSVAPTEHDGADRGLVEVQRQTDGAIGEFEQFVDRRIGQS